MSKVKYGNDWSYARTRLKDTLVMHNGKPFYIYDILLKGGFVQGCYTLTEESVDLDDELHLDSLDLTPPKMGFVNKHDVTAYAARLPVRSYKQGLNSKNFFVRGLPKGFISVRSRALAKTLVGSFPKLVDCAEEIANGEAVSRAFSHDFCISAKKPNKDSFFEILFKGSLVGTSSYNLDNGNMNINFNNEYFFLQESLEEALKKGGNNV